MDDNLKKNDSNPLNVSEEELERLANLASLKVFKKSLTELFETAKASSNPISRDEFLTLVKIGALIASAEKSS